MKRYKCRVCGKEFSALIIHLHKDEENLLKEKSSPFSLDRRDIKPDHLSEYKIIKRSLTWDGFRQRCFCGGYIASYFCEEEDELVEISCVCNRCKFLWAGE